MRIPAYQIYNVLQQYTEQLISGGAGGESDVGQSKPGDNAGFFAAVNCRELHETIRKKINDHISLVQSSDRKKRENENFSAGAVPEGAAVKHGEIIPFVYNRIDADHGKVKRAIAVTRFYEP